nr:tripartite tricarboxylate transporter TctB family protein [Nitratireductor aquimarinus]
MSAVAFAAFAIVILAEASGYPDNPSGGYGSAFFPSIIAVGTLCVAAGLMVGVLRRRLVHQMPERRTIARRDLFGALLLVALTAFAAYAFKPLGFLPTAFLVTFVFMLERRGRPLSSFAYSAISVVVIYYLFARIFSVSLPAGVLAGLL